MEPCRCLPDAAAEAHRQVLLRDVSPTPMEILRRKFMVYRCASRVLLALDLGWLVRVCEDEPGAYSSALMTRGGLCGASRAPLASESEI